MNILSLYEKLEGLVHKLPSSLQSPILREIRPLKTLFLQQRPPRVLLVGDRAASRSALFNALFASEVAQTTEDHLQDGTWQLFQRTGRLRALDARRPAAISLLRRALTNELPDAIFFVHTEPRQPGEIEADVAHANELLRVLREKSPDAKPKVFGISVGSLNGTDPHTGVRALETALQGHLDGAELAVVFSLTGTRSEVEHLATALAEEVGEEAQLEVVRFANLKDLQRQLAQTVVKSVSAISGAVGAQPIPLADFPVLTGLQAGMVAGIMYISGRDLSMKMAGEWIGALGANVGAALVMREGARAVLKIVPVWGDLVSGGIAAAGTYGIGKAAMAYFIDGLTLPNARAIFKKKERPPKQLVG